MQVSSEEITYLIVATTIFPLQTQSKLKAEASEVDIKRWQSTEGLIRKQSLWRTSPAWFGRVDSKMPRSQIRYLWFEVDLGNHYRDVDEDGLVGGQWAHAVLGYRQVRFL